MSYDFWQLLAVYLVAVFLTTVLSGYVVVILMIIGVIK